MWFRLALVAVVVFSAGVAVGYILPGKAPADVETAALRDLHSQAGVASSRKAGGPSSDYHLGTASTTRKPASNLVNEEGGLAQTVVKALRDADPYRRMHRLFAIAAGLDAGQLAEAMAFAESSPSTDRDRLQPILLGRWLDLDPSTAFEWVRGLSPGPHRDSLLKETFGLLGAKNPEVALQFLEALSAGEAGMNQEMRRELFRAWAERDPISATRHALTSGTNPEAATALSTVVKTWAKRDPKAALAWVKQLPPGDQSRNSYRTVIGEWAELDPVSAADDVLALPPGVQRDSALAAVIGGASLKAPELARTLLDKLSPGTAKSEAISGFLGILVHGNPSAAAEYLRTFPPNIQTTYGGSIAVAYARQDVAGALDWASRLEVDGLRERMVPAVVKSWAAREPRAAFEYALSNGIGDATLLPNLLGTWAKTDPNAALARARSLADATLRESALAECYGTLALTEPEKAARGVGELSGQSRSAAIGRIAGIWAYKDPVAAAAWIMNEEPDPTVPGALPRLVNNWALRTPVQAAEWLSQLPAGKVRDSAVASFTAVVRSSDPETGASWALTIQDEKQREVVVREAVQTWLQQDSAAARRWLQQTPGVPVRLRQELLH